MTKLSQPMIVALHEIYAKTIKSNITVKAQTLTALDKRGLITDGEFTGEPAIFLTDAGKEAIGIVTLAEILPGESVEVTGSYAGGHSQEQILELLGETEESQEVKAEDLTPEELTEMLVGSVESDEVTHVLDSDGILKTSPLGEYVEAPIIPFFNRAARRQMRRNVARFGRSVMRLHGKRTKRFGANVVIKHAA